MVIPAQRHTSKYEGTGLSCTLERLCRGEGWEGNADADLL